VRCHAAPHGTATYRIRSERNRNQAVGCGSCVDAYVDVETRPARDLRRNGVRQLMGHSVILLFSDEPVLGGAGVRLEIAEHVGEVAWILVHAQHPRAVLLDDTHTPRPEALARVAPRVAARQLTRRRLAGGGGVDEERLERVADLVAHVRVGQVETRQHDRLQLSLARHLRTPASAPAR